jgi:acyl-CoA synthetase (AMP-forming)/AMP-acid ligase II/thioesterase domain-containing protein
MPLSYAALWEQCQYVEGMLRSAGFGPESCIAAVLPNSAGAASAFLCFAANCTYAPLNPGDSAAGYEAAFKRLAPSAVLILEGHPSAAQGVAHRFGLPLITLRFAREESAGRFYLKMPETGGPEAHGEPRPDNVALLLQTSGTASEPKAVIHTHQTLLRRAEDLAACFKLSAEDRTVNLAPLFHGLGLLGTVMTTAVSGGSTICGSGFDPLLFFEQMDEFSPTWFGAAPSILQSLLQHEAEFQDVIRRSPLRFVRSGAAPLPRSVAEQLERVFEAPLIQVYGMAEAGPITCEPLPPRKRKPGSVGVAAGSEIAIVDDRGTPLNTGEAGQVVVRGANVTTGYWNDPEATRAAYKNGWFQTGDCGYLDSDGYLFLTGRISDIINRGGEKISPAEVDGVFGAHPWVAQALTFAIPDDHLGEELAIAIVPQDDGAVTAAELQRYAAVRLAFHKIPRHYFFVDKIPLGATGKSSRQLLRDLWPKLQQPATPPHVAPRTTMEHALARLWSDVLHVAEPGIHDHFFDSGGDSLSGVRLLAAISEEFNRDLLPLALLMEAPTIAEMAVLLSDRNGHSDSGILALQPRGSRVPLFLIGVGFEAWHLAEGLGVEQPVFSVRMPEFDNLQSSHTIQAVAFRYLEILRRFRPHGPYVLGGWCASGVIAFEMARLLEAEGADAPLVVLLDARNVLSTSACRPRIADKLHFHINHLRPLPIAAMAAYVFARSRVLWRLALKQLWNISYKVFAGLDSPLPGYLHSHSNFLGVALRAYRPQSYRGRIVQFWAADRQSGTLRQLEQEWSCVARGPVTCHEIQGNHISILQPPNVGMLASILATYLNADQPPGLKSPCSE